MMMFLATFLIANWASRLENRRIFLDKISSKINFKHMILQMDSVNLSPKSKMNQYGSFSFRLQHNSSHPLHSQPFLFDYLQGFRSFSKVITLNCNSQRRTFVLLKEAPLNLVL
jgi:hypothetical protein